MPTLKSRRTRQDLRQHPMVRGDQERLVAVALKRNETVESRGFKSHWQLRAAIDPNNHNPHMSDPRDMEGFLTSTGRFVTRQEAITVAVAAGQISNTWATGSHRPLLSSDINW